MVQDIPLSWYQILAAAVFTIGLFGVMTRRNAIALLMSVELMLNAANINILAFWRLGTPRPGEGPLTGVVLAVFVITVAAAEVAVGIALVLACYRTWKAADVDRYDSMTG
jgi:NADH-quinone oxidoreductase subunit K